MLRALPSVSSLLERDEVRELMDEAPRTLVVEAVRDVIRQIRDGVTRGEVQALPSECALFARLELEVERRNTPSLRPVINATGIVLHTGLGRAPLSDAAVEAIVEGASGYCNLEFDLATGERGQRAAHCRDLLASLTGAESAAVVNNNAAATLLILNTFAGGREVVVSRGQLIEIGGSYRLPEIMTAGGVTLREVGTTNRTRLSDYERAINDRTGMILRAHPSNYRVVGFTEDVAIAELAALAHRFHLPCVDDLGSGALFDLTAHGLPEEPSVQASIAAGADLACFSGDKLLGGPQCGVIVGKADAIKRLESNPLMRAFRVGKLSLLALEATLRAYLDPEEALRGVPVLRMLSLTTDELADRAERLRERLFELLPDEEFFVCSDVSYAGGGSMPQSELPTVVVRWKPTAAPAERMAKALREGETPVVARVRDDAVYFDLRTVREIEVEPLVAAICAATWDDDESEAPEGISLPIL